MKRGKKQEPSFEEALEQLEALVEAVEEGEVPLAELVAKYEQGNTLIKACQKKLREAELKIEQLKKEDENDESEGLEPMGI